MTLYHCFIEKSSFHPDGLRSHVEALLQDQLRTWTAVSLVPVPAGWSHAGPPPVLRCCFYQAASQRKQLQRLATADPRNLHPNGEQNLARA